MTDRDTFIEHEAFALPATLVGRHGFQIFQNAALQVIDLIESLRAHEGGRLLTADAAGAEHRHFRFVLQDLLRAHPVGQFAETARLRIDRPLERAELHLVVIATVDHDDARLIEQSIPLIGLHIRTGHPIRIYARHSKRHDLLLEPYLHSIERPPRGTRLLVLQIGKSRIAAQVRKHFSDLLRFSRNRAVDAFGGEQDRPFHIAFLAYLQERRFQACKVGERNEFIEGGGDHLSSSDGSDEAMEVRHGMARYWRKAGSLPMGAHLTRSGPLL